MQHPAFCDLSDEAGMTRNQKTVIARMESQRSEVILRQCSVDDLMSPTSSLQCASVLIFSDCVARLEFFSLGYVLSNLGQ